MSNPENEELKLLNELFYKLQKLNPDRYGENGLSTILVLLWNFINTLHIYAEPKSSSETVITKVKDNLYKLNQDDYMQDALRNLALANIEKKLSI